ncbi:hypothetical protein [Klebsiella phage KL01]|uniref:Uncharacterized protein n=1 Tax=Klebsiella phage KL01 TaxID=3077152 RepID=A0AA96PP02_9CAUD|nr:hypothetical protein [Sphingobacterium alkalisoli]WNV46815.1 hypothetical protein [Klebsiella phage KL01]GGH32470.1 hypothetical protein GCM10011418_46000 [Sphingobacterium alkalisoli]
MQLIFVTGLAHGKVQSHEGEQPPDFVRVDAGLVDAELGILFIKYRLVYWNKKEAYYVPFAYRTGYALKLLLEMK